ncbi:MAG TPA: FlgD immunoglobulin-like domain containing protein [Candidatus Krumholzibacteria bacterium]
MKCWSCITAAFLLFSVAAVPANAPPSKPDVGGPQGIMVLDGSPVHDIGELRLHMSNWGAFGSWPGSALPFSAAPSGEWPAGSGIEHVFTGGLWVGALKEGVPAVSTAAYEWEFRPSQDVRDVVYRSAEGTVGGTRSGWPGADDDHDGRTDEDPLNGYDDDTDGQIDEDYAAISDQMFSRQYVDNHPTAIQAYPQHNPLNIFVRERSYQWTDDDFDDFIGIDYEITNTGPDVLEDVYFGIFFDGDVGNRNTPGYNEDDIAGYVRIPVVCTDYGGVSLDYGYVADATTSSTMGVLMLDHVIDRNGWFAPRRVGWTTFAHFSGSQSFEDGGDPTNDFERYELMSRQTIERDGTVPRDYRILLSVGPFAPLVPESTLTFSIALFCSPAPTDSVNASRAALAYRGQWINRDGDVTTGVNGRETRVDGPADPVYVDSCLAPGDPPVFVPRGQTVWINNDCGTEDFFRDACGYDTPELYATGVNGKEHHVHWVLPNQDIPTAVAIQRFDAHRYGSAVKLEWDVWSDEDIAGYSLLRATGSGPLTELARNLPAEQRAYVDDTVQRGTRYEYQLLVRGSGGSTIVSQRVSADVPRAGLALRPNMPNPFASTTRLAFTLPERAGVELSVFDVAGRWVTTVFSGEKGPGDHEIEWNGRGQDGRAVGAGVYFLRLKAGKQSVTRKMLVVR